MRQSQEIPAFKRAFLSWVALTVLIAVSLLSIALRWGQAGFDLFIQQPPLIYLPVTLASVALIWLSIGALLFLLQSKRLNAGNALSIAGFFSMLWLYLNFLSERFRYGDYQYYFEAASRLYENQPLPPRYLYLPFWAWLLQFLAPLGEETFFLILWFANILALLLLYVLLHRALEHYGFSHRFAALTTILFMLVNAPLLRNLVYVQVNLHTLNLILLSFMLYPKRPWLSALTLALAVHLKSSPAVLVLPFLLVKDWRWLTWFTGSMILVAAFTAVTDGFSPFLDFLNNIQGLASSTNTIFHETSFDSFIRFIAPFLQIDQFWARVLIYALKLLLAAATFVVMARSIRKGQFFAGNERGAMIANSVPALFILMTLASPVVWEHHAIFLALPFPLMLKQVETPYEWLWFGFAYLLEFVLPTFDFFPWSYGRLLAPLIVLWLIWRTNASALFPRINDGLENITLPGK